MREIVLDTETTGTEALKGDRIVEIGCVELMNHVPTGQTYHVYLNPERPMSEGAFRVHGLSDAFLADKPIFAAIADPFLAFLGNSRLIIHNASFDIGFLEMELGRLGRSLPDKGNVIDTLTLARRKHPGASNSLDALCQRYGIDNRKRVQHGALLDAELLADVYLELIGGKQTAFSLATAESASPSGPAVPVVVLRGRPAPLPPRLTEADIAAHLAFTAAFPAKPVWDQYVSQPVDEDTPAET
jgi:DNA polymerase-3 subunit epsilon